MRNLNELDVPIQRVIGGTVGLGRLEIFPVLAADEAEVIASHGISAEVGRGLETTVKGWIPEFEWWKGREGWAGELLVMSNLAWIKRLW